MLVLTRKKSQRIRIAKDIWLTLLEVEGDKCRLGFEAPRDVKIVREEVIAGLPNVANVDLGGSD